MGNVDSEDGQLWSRSLKGEAEAFVVLFDRHRDLVFRHAYRLSGDRHEAEDIYGGARPFPTRQAKPPICRALWMVTWRWPSGR